MFVKMMFQTPSEMRVFWTVMQSGLGCGAMVYVPESCSSLWSGWEVSDETVAVFVTVIPRQMLVPWRTISGVFTVTVISGVELPLLAGTVQVMSVFAPPGCEHVPAVVGLTSVSLRSSKRLIVLATAALLEWDAESAPPASDG